MIFGLICLGFITGFAVGVLIGYGLGVTARDYAQYRGRG